MARVKLFVLEDKHGRRYRRLKGYFGGSQEQRTEEPRLFDRFRYFLFSLHCHLLVRWLLGSTFVIDSLDLFGLHETHNVQQQVAK